LEANAVLDLTRHHFAATVTSGAVDSAGLENGYSQKFQSAMQQQPLNGFIDNSFYHVNSSVNNTARGASTGKVSGVSESSNLVDAMKFASSPTTFHPHSLPEYHGSLANGSPYNFSSTISNKAGNIGAGVTEAANGRHIHGISSTGNLAEFNGGGECTQCLCAGCSLQMLFVFT
jgi:hypothetical protein